MGSHWLADAEPETFWAHRSWTDFAALPQREYAVVVLPVHGFADHGSGLPLDQEEVLGSRLLRAAVKLVGPRFAVRVLPPLRFVPAVPDGFFGLDPETAGELVLEVAASVKAAGFRRLVFLNTNAAHEPFVATAAIDARAAFGLRTYVVHAATLGVNPAGPGDGDLAPAAAHLAGLLGEIRAHLAPPLPPPSDLRPEAPDGAPFPTYRPRYLPARTSAELAALPARDRAVAILPTGAIEQHGPHLPVGVDAILGQALLDAALTRLPPDQPVWVAPPVTYGKSNEHLGYPGTITVSARVLRRIVLAVARQLQALGVRRLVILNTHGGNSAVLAAMAREAPPPHGLDVAVLHPDGDPELGAQEAAWGLHAGEWETSLMLACAPDLVRMDRAVGEYPARLADPGELRPERAPATFAWLTRDVSRYGVLGDARAATAEKGRRWLAAAADRLAARLAG